MTAEQLEALWSRLELLEASVARLERRVARDWKLCGAPAAVSP